MKILAGVLLVMFAVNTSADTEVQPYVSFTSENNPQQTNKASQEIVFTPNNTLHLITNAVITDRYAFDNFNKKVKVTYYKDSEKYGDPNLSYLSDEKEMSYAERAYYALSGDESVSNKNVAIGSNGQVLLTNVNPSSNFDIFIKKVKVVYYEDTEEGKKEAAYKAQLTKKPSASIGMTKSQVKNKTNWGDPNYIKTTTNKYGTHEQWVYDDYQYLYFDNGKLTTIQQ